MLDTRRSTPSFLAPHQGLTSDRGRAPGFLFLAAVLAICATGITAGEQRVDRSKEFSYTLPDGCRVVSGFGAHDLILLPATDGKNRSVVINDQPGSSPLPDLKEKYERDLAKALKDFRLIDSKLVELNGGGRAVRMVHSNTAPGIPVRQVNFIVELGERRYFIACTVRLSDGDTYDALFDAFANSMAASTVPGGKRIVDLVDVDKMTKLLGDGWKRDRSMVIEQQADLARLPEAERKAAETILKQLDPHGVVACGEFSFARAELPLDNVAVRVFRFSSAEKASAFRKLKYESENAQPLYRKSETKSAIVYDSLETKKRILFHDVYWITCGHIQNDDAHIRILEACVNLGPATGP